ncbi:MAG: methyltransferase domain-containing protein [Myxococcales bacterium]|nr:methyltransferase domain-containing protein [Myxococcales bacterium]
MTWDPDLYLRFRDERAQPFYDLLALVEPVADMDVVDLGCGTGELTAVLVEKLRARSALGVDKSPEMLDAVAGAPVLRDLSASPPGTAGLRFALQDITRFDAGPVFDLVFSNAALHWLPDHPALLARLAAMLKPGGQLAVQMPRNEHHPGHRLAAELASEAPWQAELGGFVQRFNVDSPAAYATLLASLGFQRTHVRLQVYSHRMPDGATVADFLAGSLLTGYKQRLTPARYREFFAEYRRRVGEALGVDRPYLYTFERLLFWARS